MSPARVAFLSFLAALALAAPAWSFVLAGFGDSITQGYPYIDYVPNGARVGGYEPTLEELFSRSGTQAAVHNYGWAGERTSVGVTRIGSVLSNRALQVVLLLEGTNDLVDGTAPATVAFNLGVMVDKVKAAGAIPIIGTITPDTRPNRFKPIGETNNLIRQLAANKGVPSCDLHGGIASEWASLSDDLLHPNVEGYKRLAGIWHACASQIPKPLDPLPLPCPWEPPLPEPSPPNNQYIFDLLLD